MIRVGINGFGRIGRLAARALLTQASELGMELVHINDIAGGAEMAAYLLEFDSTHGRFRDKCTSEGDNVVVHNQRRSVIRFTKQKTPKDIPWEEFGVDIVLDCSGAFVTPESLQGHFSRGVKKVVVSSPVDSGGVLNVVVGCNDHLITPDMKIVTAASCTTNCAAPIVGAIDATLGIEMGSINTVHNVTPTQAIMDVMNAGKKNDPRRARSGSHNLAPTTTGSAKAVSMIYPHLKGKLDGLAIRVPCQNASITDLVLMVKRDTSAEEVNAILKAAAEKTPGVLGFETRLLVSTDFMNDSRSSIVDAASTKVVSKRLVKIFSWYDNEWGYANRMIDIAAKLRQLPSKL